MIDNHKIIFYFLLVILLPISFLSLTAQDHEIELTSEEKNWIANHPVINVGNERFWPPIDFTIDGEAMGYSIDLMNLIANKLGIGVKYVNGMSWEELLEALSQGSIDVLPAISKTNEREGYIKFSRSYIKLPYVKVINGELPDNEANILEDKTIGVFKGSWVENALISNYPNIKLVHLETVVEAIQKVSTGEVDVFIENLAVITYYLNESYIPNVKLNSSDLNFLESPDVYIGVLKKNDILGGLIDKGLDAVSGEDLNKIRNKWMPIATQNSGIANSEILTEEERQWLSNQPPMKVANEMGFAPFNFSEGGVPKGYSIDLIKLVSEKIGMPLEFVGGNTWPEIIEKFKRREIDILPYIYFMAERLEFMAFTESYETNPPVLVVNRDNSDVESLDDLSFKEIVVVGGSTAEILKNKFPDIKLVFVDSPLEGLNLVSTGESEAFIASLGTVSYLIAQNFIPNIKLIGDVNLKNEKETKIHFSVTKDRVILRNILQKGLDEITVDEKNTIRQKWMTVEISSNKEDEYFKSSDLWKVIITILILFILFYLCFKWVFRRLITEKVALEFGSKKFRIKTNFYLTVLVVIIASIGWIAIAYIEGEFKNNLKLQLENDLKSANGRLDFWLNQKKDYLKSLGHDQHLIDLTTKLVDISKSNNKSRYNAVHDELVNYFEEYDQQGNFIINEQGFNIGSVDTSFVGIKNSVVKFKPELVKKVFTGEVVFVPPLFNDVELNNAQQVTSKMYFLIPIEDSRQNVVAAIIQEINPELGFSEILQLSHVGETGESYIFNRNGRMLSRSRFETDLKNLDIFQTDNIGDSYLNITDPGGDLTIGYNPKLAPDQRSLTFMAKSAIEGVNGVNVDGYNDYRGVPVMGAWTWIDKLELGLATEIDVDEAFNLFYFIRLAAMIVLGLTLFIIIGSILFTLSLGEKANKALLKAKDELEDRVKLRTTELNNEKAFLNSLMNAIPDPISYKNIELEYLGANKAFENHTGHHSKDFIGKTDNYFSLEENLKSKESDEECLRKLTPISIEKESVNLIGKKIIEEILKTPFKNDEGDLSGIISIARDITERKKVELRLKSQSAALKSAANGVVITNTKGEIVWINPAFTKLTGYPWREVIGKNPRILNSGKHDKQFYSRIWNTILAGKTWQGEVINKKKNGELFYEEMTITPVLDDIGNISQFVAIKNDITRRKEMEEVMRKANERMEDELNVARNIQMSMLPLIFPAFPTRDEIDIYAELIPAREVGGDFYDFYFLDKNHICFVVGDVSGKGVPAALMMAVTKTLLKSRAGNEKSTASILTHVNNEIAKDNDTYMFITVFMAILNTNTGELTYSNAGHNPSYVIDKENKKIEKLGNLHGLVIGAMEGMTYGETQVSLKKNDIVLAYTDGVTESQNIKEELYSDARFEELLQNGDYDSTKSLTKLIIDSVKEFEGEADQFDDITVMALEYCQNPNEVSSVNASFIIKNDLKEIVAAIEWVEAFSLENKVPFKIIQKINIAFDELLNNIISYGYKDDNLHEIEIEIELRSERLIIIISDDGSPFNPFNDDPPNTMLSVEERMIGGLGIHIVKNLMDEYEYKRNVNMNVITLVKYNINQ
ncbi:MAG: PAS domain S-box-containing protein [Patiriisocius sp.]|jgi:PAS domain S-box-containing protein